MHDGLVLSLMPEKSTAPLAFGDLLALARRSWVRQMAARLARLGYQDYRRSDAALLRLLRRGPIPIGRLGLVLGVTRQGARKAVDGLAERHYARTERDADDSRRLNVVLTSKGEAYAQAIVEVIDALNRELSERVDPAQLSAAEVVLRAATRSEDLPEKGTAQPEDRVQQLRRQGGDSALSSVEPLVDRNRRPRDETIEQRGGVVLDHDDLAMLRSEKPLT